jgi:hypothetical protein
MSLTYIGAIRYELRKLLGIPVQQNIQPDARGIGNAERTF